MVLVRCDICGYSYDSCEPVMVKAHNLKHASIHDLELPSDVRDAIRMWAEVTLRNRTLEQSLSGTELSQIKAAIEVMKHMWWNEEYARFPSKEAAFEYYRAEIRKRYTVARLLDDSN